MHNKVCFEKQKCKNVCNFAANIFAHYSVILYFLSLCCKVCLLICNSSAAFDIFPPHSSKESSIIFDSISSKYLFKGCLPSYILSGCLVFLAWEVISRCFSVRTCSLFAIEIACSIMFSSSLTLPG